MSEALEEVPADNSRRRMMAGAALGGAVVAGAAAGGITATFASGSGWRRSSLTLDVACIGETWRDSVVRNPADEADFRTPFLVEGIIYPEGTVSNGFVPTQDGAIGRWFCQGWTILDGSRPEPHVSSRQTYVLGSITEEELFPPNTIASTGIEGTFGDQVPVRAVVGGTGEYMGACGEVLQIAKGVNTTVFADGTDDPALNFQFQFDLIQPDI